MKKFLLILTALILLFGMMGLAAATDYDDGSCPSEDAKANNNGQHHWSYEPGEVATCTTDGYYYYICTYCGQQRQMTVGALGHDWSTGQVIRSVTCTEAGEIDYICNRCQAERIETIPATGHDWGPWTVESTGNCQKPGISSRVCNNDSSHRETMEVPGDHDFGDWVTVSSGNCVEPAKQQRTCKICGYSETRDGSLGDHEYGEWTVTREANCQQTQLQQRTCKHCGNVETKEGTTLGDHQYGNWIIDEYATCERRELQRRHCQVCGFIEWRYVGFFGDHVWGEWEVVREATKEEPGLKRRVCKKNKDHIEEEEIAYVPGPEPAIQLAVRYTSAAPYMPGQSFPVTLEVTNTGNVPLTYVGHGTYGPSIETDVLEKLPEVLSPGETWTAEHTITIVTDDYNNPSGMFERSWDVTYDHEGTQVWDEVVLNDILGGDPNQGYTGLAIEVVKTTPDKAIYFLNDTLEFDVTLKNRSSFALTDSHVYMSLITGGSGSVATAYNTADLGISALESGASVTFHVVHTVDANDINTGSQKITITGADLNLAGETGYDPEGPVTAGRVMNGSLWSDDWAISFSAAEKAAFEAPHLTLTVTQITTPKEIYAEGDTLAFEIILKNDGNEMLEGCQANFTFSGEMQPHVYGSLYSMKQDKYTCYYTVTAQDAAAGKVALTWEAFGLRSGWRDVKDLKNSDPHVVWAAPVAFAAGASAMSGSAVAEAEPDPIRVTKWEDSTPNNGSYYTEGEQVAFIITVENVSDETVRDVTLYDNLFESETDKGTVGTWEEIPAHETRSVKCTYTVTELDTLVGYISNIGYTEAHDHNGNYIASASDPVVVPAGKPDDAIKVVKEEKSAPANGSAYALNETIKYTITLENTGDTDLTDVIIADNQAAAFMGEIASIELLHAGQKHTVEFEYTVNEMDLAYGYVKNYAIIYYMTPGSLWYKTTESEPVTSPTGTVPAVPPAPPVSGKADSCVRTLLADGNSIAEYSLHTCAEHKSIYNLVNTALKVVSSREDQMLVWQKAKKLWKEELDKEYQQLYSLLSNEGKAAAITDRLNFLNYLDTLEAMLIKTGTVDEAEVAQLIADMTMDRVADLCYLCAHMGENRPDSLVTGHWAALDSTAADRACSRSAYMGSDGNIRILLEMDEAHSRIKAAEKDMLTHAAEKAEILTVWQRSRRLWQADLDSVTNYRYKAADPESRKIIAANRTAFDKFVASDSALMTAAYPYSPEAAAEIMSRAMRDHVMVLCGRWSVSVVANPTGAISATAAQAAPVPQAPQAESTPEPQAEVTPVPAPEETAQPVQPTPPPAAATMNPDGTEPSGSLVVRVNSQDDSEYTLQIYLKNDSMTFNPMMQLTTGKYGTIKRAGGEYTLQLIPVNGAAIISIDGQSVSTDENGVYTATITVLSGIKQEINVVLGNANR